MSERRAEQERAAFQEAMMAMYDELRDWRQQHPEASFDEIANQLTPRRREVMGELLAQLAHQHGDGTVPEGLNCPECGQALSYRGQTSRGVIHLEGESKLKRAYYYCPACRSGFSPPG